MSYAVFHRGTQTIVRDEQNYQHIYGTREQAQQVADKLNKQLHESVPYFVVRAI